MPVQKLPAKPDLNDQRERHALRRERTQEQRLIDQLEREVAILRGRVVEGGLSSMESALVKAWREKDSDQIWKLIEAHFGT